MVDDRFGGHLMPGTFLILYGIWWTINIFIRYYSSLRYNATFTSTFTFPCKCLCGSLKNWPIESCILVFITTFGLSLEIYHGMSHGVFTLPGNAQHATIFFSFAFLGVIGLLLHFKFSIPKDLDYVMAAMTFIVEWILFRFHLHGRTPLDVLLHTLLMYIIGASIISILIEMKYRHNVLSPLFRVYCFLLQGTWLWQIGYILYNPNQNAEKWKQDDHEQMMYAAMFFIWHGFAIFVIMLLTNGIVKCVFYRMHPFVVDKADNSLDILMKSGYSVVSVEDSDDSDKN